jgi:hypothetical protein
MAEIKERNIRRWRKNLLDGGVSGDYCQGVPAAESHHGHRFGHTAVRIERTLTEVRGSGQVFGPPKTDAGHRTVTFPDFIVPDLTNHLAQFTAPEADALVFTSPTGTPLRPSNFRRRAWAKAAARIGRHSRCSCSYKAEVRAG